MIPDHALPRHLVDPWMDPRTAEPPGVAPLAEADWLHRDATHAAQMALRDRLAAERTAEVTACLPEGAAAVAELLALVLADATARHDARRTDAGVRRADGVEVPLDGSDMVALARLVQEDLLILQRPEGAAEHVLTAGTLLFPARWSLREKLGRPLVRIHKPVREYDDRLAAKVQRFHDGVKVGRPLWRANWNFQTGPDLWTPGLEADRLRADYVRAEDSGDWREAWIRVERQTLRRLPETGAVVFGVRTMVAPLEGCSPAQWAGLARALAAMSETARTRKAPPAVRAEIERRAAAAA